MQGKTPIALRPPEVAARVVPGHREVDLIKGAANGSAVGTRVERTRRFIMLTSLADAGASAALEGFARRLHSVPPCLRKTLAYDQGSDMARHQDLAQRLRIDIHFCDPHSPWQRGTNENANGLIREFLPEGADLKFDSDGHLRRIERLLDNRPRARLGLPRTLDLPSQPLRYSRRMNQSTIEAWHALVRSHDPRGLDSLLAEDAVFISPVVHTPQRGKTLTKAYLSAAFQVFFNPSFRYVREIQGPSDAMLEFETDIDGVSVNGVDIIKWNADGKIIEFKVMIRPLKAIQIIHERMAAMLAALRRPE